MRFIKNKIILIGLVLRVLVLVKSISSTSVTEDKDKAKHEDILMTDEVVSEEEHDTDLENFDNLLVIPDDKSTRTSQHLERISKFYNDTTILLDKIEIVVRADPFNAYVREVYIFQERVQAVIKRLDNYLTELAENGPELNQDQESFKIFMKSVDADIEDFNEKFPHLEQMKEPKILLSRVNDEREVSLALMEDMAERLDEFNEAIEILEVFGIELRDPDFDGSANWGDDDQLPENYDLSVLSGLAEIYRRIEKYERILFNSAVKKERSKDKENPNPTESNMESATTKTTSANDKLMISIQAKLKIANQEVKEYLENYGSTLRQFYQVITKKRQRIWELMMTSKTENDEQLRNIQRISQDSLSLLKELDDIYIEVKESYEQTNPNQNQNPTSTNRNIKTKKTEEQAQHFQESRIEL